MPLQIGDQGATTGMTKEIYDKLNELFQPKVPAENLADAQKGWKDLAFAIATGVVGHIANNAEVSGLIVGGTVTLPVANNSASGPLTLRQTGPTTGLIR
jgi:hypothetical protein